MVRTPPEGTGAWHFREIPRDLMRRVKMAVNLILVSIDYQVQK